MKRRNLSALLLCLAVCSSAFATTGAERPPNFVIILADDLGYQDVGCFGSPDIRTPRLDAMANEGMIFSSFYAQPICGPSRAALMTGCYPLRVAERGNVKHVHPVLHRDEITVAEVLKTRDYATACLGKWDLAKHAQSGFFMDLFPTRQGFDYFYGTPTSNDSVVNIYRNEKLIEPKSDMSTLTRRYTDEAIAFMQQHREQPFFIYIPHTMPHTRLAASSSFKGKSTRGLYGDVVEEIDFNVGRILDAITSMGLARNTYVLFTSDNGPWLIKNEGFADGQFPSDHGGSAGPLRCGKVSVFDGGVRVPAILWGPGRVPAATTCDAIASTLDILPTFAALAGGQVPTDRVIDGEDIRHLFHGQFDKANPDKAFFYYLRVHLQAVRQGNWKLHLVRDQRPVGVAPFSDNRHIGPADRVGFATPFLVDLGSDIGETTNVAGQHPEVVQHLLALAEAMREDLGDYDRVGKNMRFFDPVSPRPQTPPVPPARTDGKKKPAPTKENAAVPRSPSDAYGVRPPPAGWKVDPFYKKSIVADGYPIVASGGVSDYALKEAACLVNMMLACRPDVRAAMIRSGSRMCILAYDEFTTDLPDFAHFTPKDFWDARARGTGGSQTDPYCSCGEENLLGYAGDPYSTECILIHEFAHNIHLRGLVNLDPTFDGRLKATYDAAMRQGLWENKYAAVNHHEYFAEGVQSWFDNNRENDHDHNHVNTRQELVAYDPGLAGICREVFGETELVYTKPATRLVGHLTGYDPSHAPRFVWPKRLDGARSKISAEAKGRKTAAALQLPPVNFNHPPRDYVSRDLHGWSVLVEQQLLDEAPALTKTALDRLEEKLGLAVTVLPAAALPDLRKLRIFLLYGNKSAAGGRDNGLEYFRADAPSYHDWLDPRMGSSVVIFNADNYVKLSDLWAVKALVHELAHAHHLEHWPELRADIYDTWDRAVKAGLYQAVCDEDKDAHFPNYAAQNHLEYFAELTAMYFVGANYFPRDRAGLKAYDPEGYALVEKLWGVVAP